MKRILHVTGFTKYTAAGVLLFFLLNIGIMGTRPVNAQGVSSYEDVETHWARQYVDLLANMQVLKGYPDGTFKPDNLMKRGEFSAAFCNLLKYTAADASTFKDVPADHWANKYVGTLQKKGIIWDKTYTDAGFDIEGDITRMEIVKMMVRTSPKAVEATKNNDIYYPLYLYSDYNRLDEAMQRYIGILYEANIMRGFPDKTFRLDQPATRAEIATLLEKFLTNREKVEEPVVKQMPPEPKTGVVGNMFYVDEFQLPQNTRAFVENKDITAEGLPLYYRIENVTMFNYDSYNENTPGYDSRYKDLMGRYQHLWKKIKEEKREDLYEGYTDYTAPDSVKDLTGKNMLCVEYSVVNNSPHKVLFGSRKVQAKLLDKEGFMMANGMAKPAGTHPCIFDSIQVEQWEKDEKNTTFFLNEKERNIIAFYYMDYSTSSPSGIDVMKYDPKNQEEVKHIVLLDVGTDLYDRNTGDVYMLNAQGLFMRLKE